MVVDNFFLDMQLVYSKCLIQDMSDISTVPNVSNWHKTKAFRSLFLFF